MPQANARTNRVRVHHPWSAFLDAMPSALVDYLPDGNRILCSVLAGVLSLPTETTCGADRPPNVPNAPNSAIT